MQYSPTIQVSTHNAAFTHNSSRTSRLFGGKSGVPSACATVQLLLGSVSCLGVAGISSVAGISRVIRLVQHLYCCGAFFFYVTVAARIQEIVQQYEQWLRGMQHLPRFSYGCALFGGRLWAEQVISHVSLCIPAIRLGPA
jgi:hypothetical protein